MFLVPRTTMDFENYLNIKPTKVSVGIIKLILIQIATPSNKQFDRFFLHILPKCLAYQATPLGTSPTRWGQTQRPSSRGIVTSRVCDVIKRLRLCVCLLHMTRYQKKRKEFETNISYLVSISSTFYVCIFCSKVLFLAKLN